MLAAERVKSIINLLNLNDSVMIHELSVSFRVCEETVRRDLDKACATDSAIIRVHGGAYKLREMDEDYPISFREHTCVEEKKKIADLCMRVIQPGKSIMLDCSTTALFIAKQINEFALKLTVITNSLRVAQELSDNETVNLICIGGNLRRSTKSCVGYQSTNSVRMYHADQAFISCTGVEQEIGMTSYNESEAQIRSAMLEQSDERYLIADTTKFGHGALNRMLPLDCLTAIITDSRLSEEWMNYLEKNHIKIIFE